MTIASTATRDPVLFSHVLKLFDTPLPAEDTEKLQEELNFRGMLSSPMSSAATIKDMCSRHDKSLVSSLVDRLGDLITETETVGTESAVSNRPTSSLST